MALYSDGVHLISNEGLHDLHLQAARMGIKRCWFHNGGGGRFPHYDIPKLRRQTFFAENPHVNRVDGREIVRILKSARKELRQLSLWNEMKPVAVKEGPAYPCVGFVAGGDPSNET